MWLHRCCWPMFEAKCVGDKFEMWVADLLDCKSLEPNDSANNI